MPPLEGLLFMVWLIMGLIAGNMDKHGVAAGFMAIAGSYKISMTLKEIKDGQ